MDEDIVFKSENGNIFKREDVIDVYHDSNGPDQSEFLQHEEPLPEKATTVIYSY
jgi:hypothetical protein